MRTKNKLRVRVVQMVPLGRCVLCVWGERGWRRQMESYWYKIQARKAEKRKGCLFVFVVFFPGKTDKPKVNSPRPRRRFPAVVFIIQWIP